MKSDEEEGRANPRDLVVHGDSARVEALPTPDETPQVGQWYWLNGEDDDKRWLGCVVAVGSNYAKLRGIAGYWGTRETRVHLDEFQADCIREPEPTAVITARVEKHRLAAYALLEEVRALTGRLAISSAALTAGEQQPETAALVRLSNDTPAAEYKAALIVAKEKTLPALFKAIETENKHMARWMSASLIPLEAEAEQLKPAIQAIERRIFNVELYAGLVEEVVQVADGEPAPIDTPVSLFQRRCYMDEECLVCYETGGMEFADLRAFDDWLARPTNRDRILPLPRCIVAFQVRRKTKEREWHDLRSFIKVLEKEQLDKLTFLYIRNGEQLFRLNTEIDFGENLFPDLGRLDFSGPVFALVSAHGEVKEIIPLGEYEVLQEKEEARKRAEDAAAPEDRWRFRGMGTFENYHPFDRTSVYFDDMSRFIENEMARHNRLVLVLQGLLDRSIVLHPHPPWQLWTPAGFSAALSLIYDDSRTLTAGEAPDFEAYRARLNATIGEGTVTVGQEDAWLLREGEKESARMDARPNSWNSTWRPERYKPWDDPGPGKLARVERVRGQHCVFGWNKPRASESWRFNAKREIRRTITVPKSRLLNVDAYRPGDFHIFFDDPRTRAEYLKWAPLLLEAEEWHAGNRKLYETTPSMSVFG